MNRTIKRYTSYATAAAIGMLAFCGVVSSRADDSQGQKETAMCYHGHTIEVPNSLVQYYLCLGATLGRCHTTSY